MKILLFVVFASTVLSNIYEINPHRKRTRKLAKKLAKRMARKLYLDDLDFNVSSFQNDQMDNTNAQTYQMEAHNRISAQVRQVGSWFGEVDLSVDDFRDQISRKLDQLNMSLQRPKIPMMGMMNGAIGPINSEVPFNGAQSTFNANSMASQNMATGTQNANIPNNNAQRRG